MHWRARWVADGGGFSRFSEMQENDADAQRRLARRGMYRGAAVERVVSGANWQCAAVGLNRCVAAWTSWPTRSTSCHWTEYCNRLPLFAWIECGDGITWCDWIECCRPRHATESSGKTGLRRANGSNAAMVLRRATHASAAMCARRATGSNAAVGERGAIGSSVAARVTRLNRAARRAYRRANGSNAAMVLRRDPCKRGDVRTSRDWIECRCRRTWCDWIECCRPRHATESSGQLG